VQFSERQGLGPATIVTLPEAAVKSASSAAVGATPPTQVAPVVQEPPPTSAVMSAMIASYGTLIIVPW
jgi:hypothetical protein